MYGWWLANRFEYAWQAPDLGPDEGPGLTWRQLTHRYWSATWGTKIRDGDGWVAYSASKTARPLAHQHCRSVRDGRGRASGADDVWVSR